MQIFSGKRFDNPIKIIQAFDNESFKKAFSEIEDFKKRPKHYLLGYIRYEAKEIFLGKKIKSEMPLLYFEVFDDVKMQRCKDAECEYGLSLSATIDYQTYKQAIEQIREEISCGNTYQVNYTYDYKIETYIDGFELYKSILPRQRTPYNCYIKNEYEEILSFSPELFFELEGNKIRTKPMKGTVKRGKTETEDKANVKFLKNDVKNRAENVMIVDLLRNDLGKIAKTGTVMVDKLFEVETHNTLHQMTSEVSAELDENITLFEIFEAIFPCGSVTGAPKISTMEIIDKLETGKRGVYCGAIGLISPEKTVFSVPIRILQGLKGFYTCRVGGAIVWDSTPEDEWEETLVKIKFLNTLPRHPETVSGSNGAKTMNLCQNHAMLNQVQHDVCEADFQLVETILVENGELRYEKEHFARMKKSAKALGFSFGKVQNAKCKMQNNCILRILLNRGGDFEIQYLPLDKIKTNRVTISKTPVNSQEPMLYHKATYRPWYEKSMEKIKNGEIFDEIFLNEKGELTEGARSNLVLQIDGELFTPPVECGLLNGVLRQKLLNEGLIHPSPDFFDTRTSCRKIPSPPRGEGSSVKKVTEKKLYLSDLKNAQKIFCINSVRGIVEAQIYFDCSPSPLATLPSETLGECFGRGKGWGEGLL